MSCDFLRIIHGSVVYVCVSQSGAGELDPQRRSGEFDLQGAPASLLSGEGSFQQGQSFTQTHGAGERAQHKAVAPPPPTTSDLLFVWPRPRHAPLTCSQ